MKKNFSYNLVYQILTILLPLITTPYLSRVLGAEKTGVYSYAYSCAYYFVMFSMLGLNNYGNREIAKVRDDKYQRSKTFWSIYFLQVITSILSISAYIIMGLLRKSDIMFWIMLIYVGSTLFDINWFFWGMEEFKITVIRNTIVKLFVVVSILVFVKGVNDLNKYALLMVLSFALSPILLWPYLRERINWVRPSLKDVLKHIKPNIVLFIPVIAASLYKVMDKIMLGNMSTYMELGYYEYSEKVLAIPLCVINALGVVMIPRISNLVSKNKNKEIDNITQKTMILGVGISTAMSFGIMSVATEFVPLFYGDGYLKCINLFYILMPSCVFLSVANIIRTQYLIPNSMDRQYTISLVGGAVVNLCINAILIPNLQSVGAAIGTLVAEAAVCIYQIAITYSVFPIKKYAKDILKIACMGVIMFAIVKMIPSTTLPILTLMIKIIIGAIVYCLLFWLNFRDMINTIIIPIKKLLRKRTR